MNFDRGRRVCRRGWLMLALMAGAVTLVSAAQVSSGKSTLDRQFETEVKPYVDKYCAGCHSGANAAAQLNLKSYATAQAAASDLPRWLQVMDRVSAGEMPPKPIPPPPSAETRAVLDWIRSVRNAEIERTAGDPGLVLARRLNGTIRCATSPGRT